MYYSLKENTSLQFICTICNIEFPKPTNSTVLDGFIVL